MSSQPRPLVDPHRAAHREQDDDRSAPPEEHGWLATSGGERYEGSVPRFEVIAPHPQHSIRVLTHDFPSEICGWGAHPEYEIHLITKTHGTFIAGDHVGTFGAGHLSLMGPNLPHDWVSDIAPGDVAVDRDVVIQFSDSWIQQCTASIPELAEVSELLRDARRGVVFLGDSADVAAELVLAVVRSHGGERIGTLFTLLSMLARAPQPQRQVLASPWLGQSTDAGGQEAVQAGLNYILENLTGDIRLATAARMAYMSEPTFSKFFKRAAGVTFSSMVKKLRVAQARRLLDTTDYAIAQVATMSGYRNIANFNRQFLAEVGTTPTQYRRLDSSLKPPPEVLSLGLRAPGH